MAEFGVTRTKAQTLCELLDVLESVRVSFTKGKYCFETRRISSAEIAAEMGITERYVRQLVSFLEKIELLGVYRKRFSRTKNYRNRYELRGFKSWLSTYAQPSDEIVPSSHDIDQRSIFRTKKRSVCFPKHRLNDWDKVSRYWRVIAFEVFRNGESTELGQASDDFRCNLIKHNISRDDPSVVKRWKAFIRRRLDKQAEWRMAS